MAEYSNLIFAQAKMVEPPITTLKLEPIKDTMVSEADPLLDYGDYSAMQVSPASDGLFKSLLGFAKLPLSPTQMQNLKSVKLVLTTTGNHTVFTTVNMHELTDNSWDESVNWHAKPSQKDAILASQPIDITSKKLQIDLTDYVKANDSTLTNNQFGFSLDSADIDPAGLSFCTKENADSKSRPVLEVQYYDYAKTPIFDQINSDIVVAAYKSSDIICDVTVQNQSVVSDIACDITVPKFTLEPLDINCDITVIRRSMKEINCDVIVEKIQAKPSDIDCEFYIEQYIYDDIVCDVTVEKLAADPVEINCDIMVSFKNPDSDIACDVLVEKQVAPPVDINCDVSVSNVLTPSGEINCDVLVEKQPLDNVDINCEIDVSVAIYKDIECDVLVEKLPIDPADINSDIFVSAAAISELVCDINVAAYATPSDINCDIEVVPGGYVDIDCDIKVEQTIVQDIICDVVAAQREAKFIDCDITVGIQAIKEIECDILVAQNIHSEITCDITVIGKTRSASYSYIM